MPLRKRRALAVQTLLTEVRNDAAELQTPQATPDHDCFFVFLQSAAEDLPDDQIDEVPETVAAAAKQSLLVAAARAKKGKPEETEADKLRKEEQAIMADITRKTALKGVKELARVRAMWQRQLALT